MVQSLLINQADPDLQDHHCNSPLHNAIIHNQGDIARLLIRHSCNLNLENKDRQTPLDLAMKHLRNDIIEMMVEKKAQTANSGKMKLLLFHAVRYHLLSLINLLVLNRGISFSEIDEDVAFE